MGTGDSTNFQLGTGLFDCVTVLAEISTQIRQKASVQMMWFIVQITNLSQAKFGAYT